jgi:hypothetical protein
VNWSKVAFMAVGNWVISIFLFGLYFFLSYQFTILGKRMRAS